MRDLGLVRGILGVPARVFEDVPLNDAGRHAVVIAHSEVRAVDPIFRGKLAQFPKHRLFAALQREIQWSAELDVARHCRIGQRLQRLQAEQREHLPDVSIGRSKMTLHKRIGRIQKIRSRHER